jgi:hypothetical protein
MAVLKLAVGRDAAIAGEITRVDQSGTSKFGKPQYKLTFTSGDELYLDCDRVDQQLRRSNRDVPSLIGSLVTIWKKPMADDPTKGFLNIDFMGAGSAPSTTRTTAQNDDYVGRDLRRRDVAVQRATSLDEISDKYMECLGKAHAVVLDYNETFGAQGVALPPESITQVAATLFIERNKAGV